MARFVTAGRGWPRQGLGLRRPGWRQPALPQEQVAETSSAAKTGSYTGKTGQPSAARASAAARRGLPWTEACSLESARELRSRAAPSAGELIATFPLS